MNLSFDRFHLLEVTSFVTGSGRGLARYYSFRNLLKVIKGSPSICVCFSKNQWIKINKASSQKGVNCNQCYLTFFFFQKGEGFSMLQFALFLGSSLCCLRDFN